MESKKDVSDLIPFDSHVHILSPALIAKWKSLGVPFSHSDDYYTNIDTILKNVNAEIINLVGMGYLFQNTDFYQEEDGYEKLQTENDYLYKVSQQYPKRIKPYFAIDPLQERALEEIDRNYFRNSRSGIKMHFSASTVYLAEKLHLAKVRSVFRKMATRGLPLLLHLDNGHPRFGIEDLDILIDSILIDLPAINLQIAHMGTSGGYGDRTIRFLNNYNALLKAGRIPERHAIVFDISAVALEKPSEGLQALTASEMNDVSMQMREIGLDHFVFGTDYPLYKGDEYLQILKSKLGLNDGEIESLLRISPKEL